MDARFQDAALRAGMAVMGAKLPCQRLTAFARTPKTRLNCNQRIEFENRKLTTAVEDRPGKGWVLAMLAALRVALVPPAR